MGHTYKIATVFGGTGFVGTQVVRGLAKRGVVVKVATRVPERAFFLRPAGMVGQVVPVACDYSAESIAAVVKDSDYVVNCIGALVQKKKGGFAHVHADIPAAIAQACAQHNVQRFVHISALGVDQGKSKYALTKFEGEKAVFSIFPAATILRPSVIFGEGDEFFNMFAFMASVLPFLPLIGGGHTKFQPVYVGDVADAVMASVFTSDIGAQNPQGHIFELGGPEIVDFRQIYARLFANTHQQRRLITLPWGIARVQASFMNLLPRPPLTPDQVESLKTDSVVATNALKLENLGLSPMAMDVILPTYLARYRPGGKFADKKAA